MKKTSLRERGVADLPQHAHLEQVIHAHARRPLHKLLARWVKHAQPGLEFSLEALAAVQCDRFHALVAAERLGQAGGGVLAPGQQDERVSVHDQ